MSESTLWWVITAFLISLELLTGSLHLLMLSLGAAAAALAAIFGVPHTDQLLIAASVGGVAVMLWHRRLLKRGIIDLDSYTTAGLSQLDLGEEVTVERWSSRGTALVNYRGADWMARHHGPHVPRTGSHRIRAIETDFLVLEQL